MLTSDRIEPRPASKKIEPETPIRVEEIRARLAALREQYHALERADWAILKANIAARTIFETRLFRFRPVAEIQMFS
jgi:hypothetical protein